MALAAGWVLDLLQRRHIRATRQPLPAAAPHHAAPTNRTCVLPGVWPACAASDAPTSGRLSAALPGPLQVRTDEVDGFLLDRGFQIFLTSYPEAQAGPPFSACSRAPPPPLPRLPSAAFGPHLRVHVRTRQLAA